MKTRHILTAIALPALLAACTQDELVEVANQPEFNGVPTVEAFFTATKGGVDTKMATQFGWEEGDRIGLGWVGGGTSGVANDGQVIYDNPLFCYDATKGYFNVNTMLPVGQYVAYMPYAEMTTKGHIPFTIEGQTLTTNLNDVAKKFIYIDPKLATLVDKKAEDLSTGEQQAGVNKNIKLTMVRLSNAVTLNLSFANVTNLKDLKVTGVSVDILDGATSILPAAFTYNAENSASVDNWTEMTGETFYYPATDLVKDVTEEGGLNLTSKEGLAPANNTLTVYATMLPAATQVAGKTLTISVSTNYGDVTITSADEDADETIEVLGSDDKAVDWDKATIFTGLGQSGTINVNVDGEKIAVASGTEVATQAELEATLENIAATAQEGIVSLVLNPEKKNAAGTFILTDFTLPEDLKATISLNPGANVTSGFVFNGENIISTPLILQAASTLNGTMLVKNCVVNKVQQRILQLGDGSASYALTISPDAVFTNEGLINGAIATTVGDSKKAAGLYISAAKTAKYEAGTFTNNGEIEWVAGSLPASTSIVGDGAIYAEVTSFETLLAADAAKVKEARFENEVTFGNSAQSVSLSAIETIVCNKPVSISVTSSTLGGPVTIDLNATEINIAEGASLSVNSDNVKNTLTLGSGAEVNVPQGAVLNLTNLTTGSAFTVNYEGTVTLTSVDDSTNNISGVKGDTGTWTEITGE